MSNPSILSPLPPPSGDVCSRCQAPLHVECEFCANCGAHINVKYTAAVGAKNRWSPLLMTSAITTVTLGISTGSCAFSKRPSDPAGVEIYMFFTWVGGVFFTASALCTFSLWFMERRKKQRTHNSTAMEDQTDESENSEKVAFNFCKAATLMLLTTPLGKFALPFVAGVASVLFFVTHFRGQKTTRCILQKPLYVGAFWAFVCGVSLWFVIK